jgi:hypothetical protein
MERVRAVVWGLVLAVACTSLAWTVRDATARAVPHGPAAVWIASSGVGWSLVGCGPPQNYEIGDEGYWDVECLIRDGAGASVLVRFTGHHVADYEVIV